MTGVPEYLKPYSLTANQKSSRLSFQLKCTCGCDVFSIIGNSYTQEEKRIKKEYEDKIPDTGWHTIYGGIDASGKPYCYIKKFFFFKKYIELPQEPVFMGINVIKAACSQCQKEIVVFDSRYNGYDSQFTTEEQKEYIPSFENSKAEVGNITVALEQDDAEDIAPELFLGIRIAVKNGQKKRIIFDAETG